MKVMKSIVIITCSLLVSLLFFLVSLKLSFFNQSFLLYSANKSDYYSLLTMEIDENITNVALGSGVPQGVLENIVDESEVKKSVNDYFKHIYTNSEHDTTETKELLSEEVNEAIRAYASENKLKVVNISDNKLVAYIQNVYTKSTDLPYLDEFAEQLFSYKNYLALSIGVVFICLVILLALLYFVFAERLHQYFRYVSYIFLSAGLLFIFVSSFLLMDNTIFRISILTRSLYALFVAYLTNYFTLILLLGLFCFIAGTSCGITSQILRKKLIHSNRRKTYYYP